MDDKRYLWKRNTHDENGDYKAEQFAWLDNHPERDAILEFAYGDTAGVHILSDCWMTTDEVYEEQLKQTKIDYGEDCIPPCYTEVVNTLNYMWIMGLAIRKEEEN